MEEFRDFGLDERLIALLEGKGIVKPTKVQSKVIPKCCKGDSMLVTWPTGSGKTLSFLLPIINKIKDKTSKKALILSPTRELALQIAMEGGYLAEALGLRLLCVYGGVDVQKEVRRLKNDFDILVATPGRLLDHMRGERLDLSKVDTLVIDEVDQMLLMGFSTDVDMVVSNLPKDFQFLGFSATSDTSVRKVAYRYRKDISLVEDCNNASSNRYIKQEVISCSDREKKLLLFKILQEDSPYMGIIFCRTKRRVDELYESLILEGYNVRAIHSDIPQPKRQRIMKEFRSGDVQYLVATDVVSRGLDISGVDSIYNYDVPESGEDYIHRIGRSGRVKDDGYALTFVVPRHQPLMDRIVEKIGEIPCRKLDR
ncbi:MAG: DEAD/DEAH box helicase [Filifactoraceae bacterium]